PISGAETASPCGGMTGQALGRRIIALVSSTAARAVPDRLAPEGSACLFYPTRQGRTRTANHLRDPHGPPLFGPPVFRAPGGSEAVKNSIRPPRGQILPQSQYQPAPSHSCHAR